MRCQEGDIPPARVTADTGHLALQTGKHRAWSYELLLLSLIADGLQAFLVFFLCWITFVCSAPNIALLGSLTCLRVGNFGFTTYNSATLLLFARGKYKTEWDNNGNRNILLSSRQFARNINRACVSPWLSSELTSWNRESLEKLIFS